MSTESLSLRRHRAKLIEEMYALTERSSFPAEAQSRWRDLDRQQKDLERQVMRAESAWLDDEMQRVIPPPLAQPGEGYPGFDQRASLPPTQENYSEHRDLRPFAKQLASQEYRSAFGAYLRRGSEALNGSQRNLLCDVTTEVRTYSGLNTGTGSEGLYVVPIGFQRELEVKLKAVGRMRAVCRLLNTATGNTLDWPTMDDTSVSGEFVNEAAPVSQANPTFGQVQFQSFLASSKQVLLSVQLFQDSAFDVESTLSEAFAIRIGRIINAKYTNGSGTGEPQGLIGAIKNAPVPNIVNAVGSNSNDGVSGNTEANSVGTDDLEALVQNVDPLYRASGKFMMHYKTIDALRRLKDRYGRPIWQSGIAEGQPDKIFGFGFEWNVDLDQIGAGNYPVVFGDFSRFVIRDVGGIALTRYSELYMPSHQLGFQSWLRTDSRCLQAAAFALLYNPLS